MSNVTDAELASSFSDDGCDVCPKCLECPLSACKYDDPRPYRVWLLKRRVTTVMAHARNGDKPAVIAVALGVGERTIRRVLRTARAMELWDKGAGVTDIARSIGVNSDTIYSYLELTGRWRSFST